MKKFSRTKFRYEPDEHIGMIMMLERRPHMFAETEVISVIGWPLKENWYPSEQGKKMLDKIWDFAFTYDMVSKA